MAVENVVFLLEEKSVKEMLDVIVPKILPEGVSHKCIPFEGKSDLENNIARKMRGWLKPNSVFLVMRDQDSGDCKEVKRKLLQLCADSQRLSSDYLVRIACHELESFYLGDLNAVRSAGYKVKLSKRFKNGYENPDVLANPSEELLKITDNEYRKVQGSSKIADYLGFDGSNKSTSFNMLVSGIKKLVAGM